MYRRLKRFDAYQMEYKRLFDQTSVALNSAGDAVRTFGAEGRQVVESLGVKIEEARSVLAELEAATHAAEKLRSAPADGVVGKARVVQTRGPTEMNKILP
jgi:formate-dependent phosphoribosylglycinamide formyltransferase (GAR transformylase)